MSKFLKVIVNIFVICAIAIAAAILIPPLAGINTTIVDSQSMDTNLPMGSVTYSKDTYITNLEVGDDILEQSSASTYKYEIVNADASTGSFEVRDSYGDSSDTKSIQILNSTPKVYFTVPFIGYVVYAMHSIEGVIIVGLVILLMVILFILSELWKKESEEEFFEEYYAAEEEKSEGRDDEYDDGYEDDDYDYEDDEYEDDDYESDEYDDYEYDEEYSSDDGYSEGTDDFGDEYEDDQPQKEVVGGDTAEFTPPFIIERTNRDEAEKAGNEIYDEPEASDEISSSLEAALEKYTQKEEDANSGRENGSGENGGSHEEEEILVADDAAADRKNDFRKVKGQGLYAEEFLEKVDSTEEDDSFQNDRFVPVDRPSYEDILVKAEKDGVDPEVERDSVTGVQIVDFSDLL